MFVQCIFLQGKLTACVLVCTLLADFALNEVAFSEERLDRKCKEILLTIPPMTFSVLFQV